MNISTEIMQLYCEHHLLQPILKLDSQQRIMGSNDTFKRSFSHMQPGTPLHKVFRIVSEVAVPRSPHIDSDTETLRTSHFECVYLRDSFELILEGICIQKGDERVMFFCSPASEVENTLDQITQMNMEISGMARNLSKKNNALEKANRRIEELLDMDHLTNVRNRRFLFQKLEQMDAYKSRHDGFVYSVVMLDIDFFKQVNDQFGHHMGDLVLQTLASFIQEKLRTEDVLVRFGGEEFVVVLTGQNAEESVKVAERLRIAVEAAEMPHGMPLTISLGVADSLLAQNQGEILNLADEALYRAKEAGRNRVCR